MREKEAGQPRRIVVKEVTEQQLLWVKQLSRACAMRDEVKRGQQERGHVTLWTKVAPDATPVFLQVEPEMTHKGVSKVIFSRMMDLTTEGLGDVARTIVYEGRRTQTVKDGADLNAPRPDRTPEGYHRERRLLEEDARELGEGEWLSNDDGDNP